MNKTKGNDADTCAKDQGEGGVGVAAVGEGGAAVVRWRCGVEEVRRWRRRWWWRWWRRRWRRHRCIKNAGECKPVKRLDRSTRDLVAKPCSVPTLYH